ncbi:hypothetical protein HCH_00978 [Hahella chejuensis KCTC 2396]|uniref:Uncharacterized protein n=1 Tax=Hahella chejuensis (strain KCTC 2396) TaxID=349521 RepID=Q2SNA9_HAHCH|nr:hypothetical protein HCH_00978 [Hahella chejuensis KCTC 2396]
MIDAESALLSVLGMGVGVVNPNLTPVIGMSPQMAWVEAAAPGRVIYTD